ncbi:MAG TPA: polysaccharide deacetylase family protein [Nitrososphaeraceae archaeon]|nr:polysaccharide deacetylase family protein [Nitrososphaeraceae archaeon]
MQRIVGILVSLFIAMTIGGNISNNVYGASQLSNGIANQQKVVILAFDDGYESQYSNGKPILDKYDFKATFSIVCNYVGNGNRMTWEEIKSLQHEGHDIASHTMNHLDLSKLPPQKVEYEVAQSKQCLLDQGINPKSFAYPFNGGSDDPSVINTVASYYDLARTATDPLAFLGCNDGCDKTKYSIMGWSHDSERKNNALNDQQMFERFIQVVNSQSEYNVNKVNAVPILIWHKIDNSNEEYSTSTNLFSAEMKYLHDNRFTVLTMADLVYDDSNNYIRISGSNDDSNGPTPNDQNQFAARITDSKEKNDYLSTKEDIELIKKVVEGEENGSKENLPVTKDDNFDTTSAKDSRSRIDRDVDAEVDMDTENQIPSGILRFAFGS